MNLITHPLFNNIDTSTLRLIEQIGIIKKYKKGDYVHFDTDLCEFLEIISTGMIEVEHLSENGERLVIKIFEGNDVIGLNVIFSNQPYYIMNFYAVSDVEIIAIPKNVLKQLLSKDPILLDNILKTLSDNSLSIGTKLKSEFKITIREKLITYFYSLYVKQESNPIDLPINKTRLASLFGVNRSSLSRELKHMEELGMIKVDFKRIYLVNIIV
jgi:CRP-like cAMP-binding protein